MKASFRDQAFKLEDIPNVGPAIAEDLRRLGIATPKELMKKDPYTLYMEFSDISGIRPDPCVLDVFMSAVDFMNGAKARPWWHYTEERKKKFGI